MIPASWKVYLDIGAFVVFCVLVGILVHHLEQVGANKILAQDAATIAADHAKMLDQERQMQAEADKAEVERDQTQKQLADYMSANPVGHVFLCNKTGSKPGVPNASDAKLSNAGSGAGSAPVPEVPDGVDIGPGLNAIVHAAGVLGGLYREYQGYPDHGAVGTAKQ